MNVPRSLLISRPDALGDAVVTTTMAGWIKQHAPSTHITVLCKRYARAVWEHCTHVDEVLVLEELAEGGDRSAIERLAQLDADAIVHVFPHRQVASWAKAADIPQRIGTSHRWWHWTTCNVRVNFSRKRSNSHEALLNMQLLAPFGIPRPVSIQDLIGLSGLSAPAPSAEVHNLLARGKRTLVVHPLLGSGVGWSLQNHAELIRSVDGSIWNVVITGTAQEAQRYAEHLPLQLPHVQDAGGKLDLTGLMMLLGASDAMVAASTGPLHMAAALGLRTIGLYSMRRPIFPARWAPIGPRAHALVHNESCTVCAAGKPCDCITRIPVATVLELLNAP
jgi:ADP-heptose:LPS heptosyltransferase